MRLYKLIQLFKIINYLAKLNQENSIKIFMQTAKNYFKWLKGRLGGLLELILPYKKQKFLDEVKKSKIPVTVLTGFLGSGKTTLLNYILSANHGKKIAVIENEFGEVGVDDQLVNKKITGTEQIIEMSNGCICCTVRGDLIKTLKELIYKLDKFDYILIETTGLADPAPVAQTFFIDPVIA